MKLRKTVCGAALLGIFLTGMALPRAGFATNCETYDIDATAEDIYEANNTYTAATPLTNDVLLGEGGDPNCGVMFAAVDLADEYDYYSIVVPEGNTGLYVDLRFKYSLGDMTLRLYGTDGTTALATASTESDNEYIDYQTPLAAGTYYVRVYSGQAGNNRYSLKATAKMPAAEYSVTPSVVGGNGSVSPSSAQTVTANETVAFTLSPDTDYTAIRTVGGDCPIGGWDNNVYTTGPVTESCTVTFSFGLTRTVTPNADPIAGGTVDPATAQSVASGDTVDFTVTANPGYDTNTTVTGTCPAGLWTDNVYTTGQITDNCTVIFGFTETTATHTVTPSADPVAGGTVSPDGDQTVLHNATKAFTVTANSDYTTNTTVTGTCPAGGWTSNVYTTGQITDNCTVIFGFTATHTVTPSADPVAGGTITPDGDQTVLHNATKAFTVTANPDYTTNTTVTGTCPAGGWAGNVYTTGQITDNCTVIFGFTETTDTHTVTPSADPVVGGVIDPNTAQTVLHNGTSIFTVTANAGYITDTVVDGTCPAGSWTDSTHYTTGQITGDCTVIFGFTETTDTHSVTPSAGTGGVVDPDTAQEVLHNGTKAFTVTANAGYTTDTVVGGTCPAGSWAGNVYTTGQITADCSVEFSFTPATHSWRQPIYQLLL